MGQWCTGWSRHLEAAGGATVGVELLYGSSLRRESTWLRVDVNEIEELSRMTRLRLGEWKSEPQELGGNTCGENGRAAGGGVRRHHRHRCSHHHTWCG